MDVQSVASVIGLVEGHARNGGSAIIATHEPLNFAGAATITLSEAA
jgi:ABC-type transport system involved in cytochrome c biogenesis ATPase subunit